MSRNVATSKELPRPPPPPKSPPPPPPLPPPPPYTFYDSMSSTPQRSPSFRPTCQPQHQYQPLHRPYTPGHSTLYTTNHLRCLNRRYILLAIPLVLLVTYLLSMLPSISVPHFPPPRMDASQRYLHPTPLASIPPTTLQQKKRVIFIGDVHGELVRLHELLDKVGYDSGENGDIVVLLGDMIAKGPDSAGVVDWVRAQGEGRVWCVRGNHEHSVLGAASQLEKERKRRRRKSPHSTSEDEDNTIDEAENDMDSYVSSPLERRKPKGGARGRKLAKSLTKEQKDFLAACPVMLQIPAFLDGARKVKGRKQELEYIAVHAGLEAAVRLQDQDLVKVMNLRMIPRPEVLDDVMEEEYDSTEDEDDEDNDNEEEGDEDEEDEDEDEDASSQRKHRKPWKIHWALFWNKWMSGKLPQLISPSVVLDTSSSSASSSASRRHDTRAVVVYGHYAAKGLDIRRWTKGLDSGCQKGGRLTAMVLDLETGEEEIVQIDCGGVKKGKGGKKSGKKESKKHKGEEDEE
ncbi:Metallo-dependent phosphatase [Ascodesmis nigricans]|uniref:Metallo-dependent phosphatase n=1 Tax=Ascodesmis nigricans TaxID=341454 RepID=A0A4S2N410_9PEZI|nr:Metallo-dependent phosphatase [Ascodesmis nigricans]